MHLPEEPAIIPTLQELKSISSPPRLLTPSSNRKRPAFLAIAPISLTELSMPVDVSWCTTQTTSIDRF